MVWIVTCAAPCAFNASIKDCAFPASLSRAARTIKTGRRARLGANCAERYSVAFVARAEYRQPGAASGGPQGSHDTPPAGHLRHLRSGAAQRNAREPVAACESRTAGLGKLLPTCLGRQAACDGSE